MVEGESGEMASAELEVMIPEGAQVSVKTVTANIVSRGATGWFNSVSGDIVITGAARRMEAETLDGDISVSGEAPWLSARTGSGGIKIEGRFGHVRASSVGGNISVLNKLAERGRFESVTGNISYTGAFATGSHLEFDTHGGAVTLVLPQRTNARFDLTSITGTIDNTFTSHTPNQRPEGTGQVLEFQVGSADATVSVRSFKGIIRLLTVR